MTDRIELTGIRALGVIGVLPEERERAQPFEINLVIEVDLSAAGASDDLNDTVDYGEATSVAAAVITTESHQLLERVAQRIAEEVLSLGLVEAVEVTVRKLRPPIPVHIEHSSVHIRRTRAAD
jgi:dihydroneopterin aldolase